MKLSHIFIKLLILFVGVAYYFSIQVNIDNIQHTSQASPLFTFDIDSKIPQTVKLHVGAKNFEFFSIRCKKNKISFPLQGKQWFELSGEQAIFKIKKGINKCQVLTRNNSKPFNPIIKQKLTFVDFTILFLLIAYPLLDFIFNLFIRSLDYLKNRVQSSNYHSINPKQNLPISFILFGILFTGIIIRIFYIEKFGITLFQHDWQGHIEFIKYIKNNWTLPLASKGLEFPQQPLYYVIAALIYTTGEQLHMHALQLVGYFSLLCSFVFLIYSYKFIRLLTSNLWTQTVAILFVSFTPSLVYMSAQINNDALVMGLSSLALYYIVKSYQSGFKISFYSALLWTTLLFLTKISTAPIEILLFSLLIFTYLKSTNNTTLLKVKQHLYLFTVLGMFILGFTLLKNYLPIENKIHMVNSSSGFPGQKIDALNLHYFSNFQPTVLIKQGYKHIYGLKPIHNSFISWQYRTMLLEEANYSRFLKKVPHLKESMQAILLFGLIYGVGFIIFILQLYKNSNLIKILFVTLLLNFMLIVHFVYSYTSTCNTDFRYYVPVFLIFSFVFAKGITLPLHFKWLKYFTKTIVILLAFSEITFFVLLLQ